MTIQEATNPQEWDAFLATQTFRPFLQSWTMGEVYRDTKQEPIRLEVREGQEIVAICLAILVPARRGRHLMIPYGPVMRSTEYGVQSTEVFNLLLEKLKRVAKEHRCSFIRMVLAAICSFRAALSSFRAVLSAAISIGASDISKPHSRRSP